MIFNVFLSPETISRLKTHAEPLVDTFDSVVSRALDALEKGSKLEQPRGKFDEGIPLSNPAAPPNLSYTTVHSIIFDGKVFAPNETYWNILLLAVIREAGKECSTKELKELVLGNCVIGKREENGYKFIKELNLSVQGRDANNAWRATYHVLKKIRRPVEVVFSWQNNPKAEAPGSYSSFDVKWD